MANRGLSTQVATGAVIVLIGVLLLLSTTGAADVGDLWQYLPSLFVLLGIWALVRSDFRNVTGPVILIIIAGTIQLLTLDVITDETVETWWPLLVILFGLSIVIGHWRGRSRPPESTDEDFDLIGIFGGSERRVTAPTFSGGSATAIFGGVEVDLRDTDVDDPPAVVTAIALFGGVELIVPREWNVTIDALPLFGGASDDRARPAADADRSAGEDLVVTGFAAFGGISVTD